jgi:GR25 family glycosyltransferase involved in LPS biosynthesis
MQFPPILVINLKERTDRWKQISKQLDDLGVSYERVEAVRKEPGWKGCAESFRKCYKAAKQRKYPWVLILEDDCLFQRNGMERFQELLPILWERRDEWDVFNGGSIYIHKACKVLEEPPLFQLKSWSAHFLLVNNHAYNRLLGLVKDHRADHFDKLRIRSWGTYPHIAIQQKGYSNIEKKQRNSRPKFHMSDKILRLISKGNSRCSTRKGILKFVKQEEARKTRKLRRSQ